MNLQFAHLVPETWRALQNEKRAGWVKRGVINPETVAEHILELLVLGAELAQATGFTKEETSDLLAMLEIHDWPEAIDGDQITLTGVDVAKEASDKVVKHAKEIVAMRSITEPLGDIGIKLFNLWLRFEEAEDRVVKAAHEIDKYQAIERAYRYEREQGIVGLGEEFVRYSPRVTHPYLVARLESVRALKLHEMPRRGAEGVV
jgi:5'-deoxynucleotidase YfbR-like HD superfamily hydrolase